MSFNTLFQRRWRWEIALIWIWSLAGSNCWIQESLAASSTSQPQASQLVSLKEISSRLGLQFCWIKPENKARLNNWWADLVFEVHKRDCYVNGIKVSLGYPVVAKKGQLYITKSDLEKTLRPLLFPKSAGEGRAIRTIVLDPGHGDKDNGTENKAARVKEKDLTLDLAYRLQKLLQQKGYRVLLTREKDTFVSLPLRSQIANQNHADLFISLHFNAAENKKAQGIETYALSLAGQPSTNEIEGTASDYYSCIGNQNDLKNTLLAFTLHKTLVQDTGSIDRSMRRARFAVLRDLQCPGVLIESGYLSNDEEVKRIASPEYRQKLAQSVAKGVDNYLQACQK